MWASLGVKQNTLIIMVEIMATYKKVNWLNTKSVILTKLFPFEKKLQWFSFQSTFSINRQIKTIGAEILF
jgi:hypothetical protein